MDHRNALHTAARRYCDQKNGEWSQSYQELQATERWQVDHLFKPGWDYSPEAYAIFPRYRLDSGIQAEVEKLRPDACSSLDEMRKCLLIACDVARTRLQPEFKNPIALAALQEEADDYRAYIQVLGPDDLSSIESLP
jgi:hypothetical protein